MKSRNLSQVDRFTAVMDHVHCALFARLMEPVLSAKPTLTSSIGSQALTSALTRLHRMGLRNEGSVSVLRSHPYEQGLGIIMKVHEGT